MTRAKSAKARIDERRYPVRVRIAVPPGGFGVRHEAMIEYLDRTLGRDGWAEHPAYRMAFPVDAIFLYFADAAAVAPFLAAFELETVEIVETLAGASGDLRVVRYGDGAAGLGSAAGFEPELPGRTSCERARRR